MNTATRTATLKRSTIRTLVTPFVLVLLTLAMLTSTVSAAIVELNMTPPQARQMVYDTLVDVKPALNDEVDQVMASALDIMRSTGRLSPAEYADFHQIFVQDKAPANYEEIKFILSLSDAEAADYSLDRLEEEGLVSTETAQLFRDLLSADNTEVRAMAQAALQDDSIGPVAAAVLQTAVMLSAIPADGDIKTCDNDSLVADSDDEYQAEGFFSWLGGLVKSVVVGALKGALIGFLTHGLPGVIDGAIAGGIRGGIKYALGSVGGFMATEDGRDCTGWPAPYPMF